MEHALWDSIQAKMHHEHNKTLQFIEVRGKPVLGWASEARARKQMRNPMG